MFILGVALPVCRLVLLLCLTDKRETAATVWVRVKAADSSAVAVTMTISWSTSVMTSCPVAALKWHQVTVTEIPLTGAENWLLKSNVGCKTVFYTQVVTFWFGQELKKNKLLTYHSLGDSVKFKCSIILLRCVGILNDYRWGSGFCWAS